MILKTCCNVYATLSFTCMCCLCQRFCDDSVYKLLSERKTLVLYSFNSDALIDLRPECLEILRGTTVVYQNDKFRRANFTEITSTILVTNELITTFEILRTQLMANFRWAAVVCFIKSHSFINNAFYLDKCCDVLQVVHNFPEMADPYVLVRTENFLIATLSPKHKNCGRCGTCQTNVFSATDSISLRNKTLGILSRSVPSHMDIRLTNGAFGIAVGGYEKLLVDTLAEKLEFKYYMRTKIHGSWGNDNSNGTWVGILEYLQKREEHYAIGDLTVMHPRNYYFTVVYPHDYDVVPFMHQKEQPVLSGSAILNIMNKETMASLVVATLLSAFVISMCTFGFHKRILISLAFCWFVFGTIVQPSIEWHGQVTCFTQRSAEALVFIWRLSSFILTTVFSSSLFTALTTPTVGALLDDTEQLANYLQHAKTVKVLISSQWFSNLFDNDEALDPHQEVIKDHCEFNDDTPRDMVHTFTQQKSIWIQERFQLRAAVAEAGILDKIHISEEYFYAAFQGSLVQRGCIFANTFHIYIRRLGETGHLLKWMTEYNLLVQEVKVKSEPQPLSLDVFQGTFKLLLLSEVLNAIIFIIETTIFTCKRIRASKKPLSHILLRKKIKTYNAFNTDQISVCRRPYNISSTDTFWRSE